MSTVDFRPASKNEQIEQRIRKTCRQVKSVDIFLTFTVLLTCLIGYLFLFALVDHWIFKGGVSPTIRKLFFFTGIGLGGFYTFYRLIPLFRYSVNPVYAAKILEAQRPTMKNSLINWIFLRRENPQEKNAPADIIRNRMIDGVTNRAVFDLQKVPEETVVDKSSIIHWGIALIIITVFFCLYAFLSPKNPFSSILRLAMPFSSIESPTRVKFREVTPGNAKVFQGEYVTVTANIDGVRK
ncbi:MAG: hypothetical protein ACRC2T_03335, partial [Thermoguttaceae bacterium]